MDAVVVRLPALSRHLAALGAGLLAERAGAASPARALAGQLDAGLTEALERLRAFRS